MRRRQQAVHGDAARGEPEDGDVVRIAAEGGDVPLHPLQGRDLVHVGVVALGLVGALAAQRGEREEAEASQAVVEGDEDDALLGERRSRRARQRAGAAHEPAPVDPHHHGQPAWRSRRRGARRSGTGSLQTDGEAARSAARRSPGRAGEAARRIVPACSSPRTPRPGARPSTAPPAAAAATAGRRREAPRRGCPCRRRRRRRPRLAARRYPPARRQALAHAPRCQHSSRPPARPASTREPGHSSKPPWLCRSVLRACASYRPCRLDRLPKPPAESA